MYDARQFKPLLFFLIFLFLTVFCSSQDVCRQINKCGCKYTNGSVVDLSTLGSQNGTPRFSDIPEQNPTHFTYSYNPCYPFTVPTYCVNVAVCQKDLDSTSYYDLGDYLTAIFYMNGSQLTINYTSTVGGQRTTTIKLICDTTQDTLTMEGENPTSTYSFTLRSKCACPDGCTAASSDDDKLSTGSVLVILLFVFLLVYILGGIIFQKIMKGATGVELLPNYEFWLDFPLLVRDGVIFTCNGCQNEVSYERI